MHKIKNSNSQFWIRQGTNGFGKFSVLTRKPIKTNTNPDTIQQGTIMAHQLGLIVFGSVRWFNLFIWIHVFPRLDRGFGLQAPSSYRHTAL